MGMVHIARKYGVGTGTVQRLKACMNQGELVKS
jgi:hypothetical protein